MLYQIIGAGYVTGSFQPAKTVHRDETLTQRTRLLGDYFGARNRIIRTAGSLTALAPRTFRIQELSTAQWDTSRVYWHDEWIVSHTPYGRYADRLSLDREPLPCVRSLLFRTTVSRTCNPTGLSSHTYRLKSQRVTDTVHHCCVHGLTLTLTVLAVCRDWLLEGLVLAPRTVPYARHWT